MTQDSLGRLQKVDLREVWETEAGNFTPWLAQEENISILGDAIGIDLEVEAQEKEVGPFRADILCKDTANNNWVLIENQLERTDHTHLGQLLTYAAGLNTVTVVWVAQRFTDEHRAALDWINDITEDRVNFFGLEIELWRIGDSPIAPKFNVVSKPNDWIRTISGSARRIETGELSETRKRYIEFWTEFGELLESRGSSIRRPKPSPDHWKSFSVGRTNFGLHALVGTRDKRLGVQLSMYGPDAKSHFCLLEQKKTEIEAGIGESLDWRELPEYKESQIRLQREGVDPADRESWDDLQNWLIDKLEVFRTTLEPIVKDLDASEYHEPGPVE